MGQYLKPLKSNIMSNGRQRVTECLASLTSKALKPVTCLPERRLIRSLHMKTWSATDILSQEGRVAVVAGANNALRKRAH